MPVDITPLITPEIQTPARYLGNEWGAFRKSWEARQVHWVLSYPEIYEVGASNLGHIILYTILNTQPRQLCDRTYLPATDFSQKLRQQKIPLFAVESRKPLQDFDVIGISLAYELGATNVLEMLELAQIPLLAQDRPAQWAGDAGENSIPLVFAGGPTATSNPEPYSAFFDFFVLGDGEEVLPEIGLVLEEAKSQGLSRAEVLLDLAHVPGVYVPSLYARDTPGNLKPLVQGIPERILRRVADPMPRYSIGLVPYVSTIHDRLVMEVRRGCTRGCRFCQPGMLTRPARDVDPDELIQAMEEGLAATGYNEFSLSSLSCSDYLSLPYVGARLQETLAGKEVSVSLPSQRVDRFDDQLAQVFGQADRKPNLTFAPEAGTQRLRDVINKGLTDPELLRGIKTAYDNGWKQVKLYFMIGHPTETDEDVLGIAETIRWLRKECNSRGPMQFQLTISNFTPKPHTPFQWHHVSTEAFEHKQALLKDAFHGMNGVRVNYTDVRLSAMEEVLGRAGREFAPIVQRAWELGAGMDAWYDGVGKVYKAWSQALTEHGLDWNSAVPNVEDILAWDFIDTGIDKAWLVADYARALATTVVPDCSFEGCSHCGICGEDFGANLSLPIPAMPKAYTEKPTPPKERYRLRVRFGKLDELRFIGHLDLIRLFERACRRAQLPMHFSEGFHPLPKISVATALPLGMTSTAEIAEFELHQDMATQDFLVQLQAQLPLEIPLFEAEVVETNAAHAGAVLKEVGYDLTFVGGEDWHHLVERLHQSPKLFVQRTHRKSGKTWPLDVRFWLHSLELIEAKNQAAVLRYRSSYTKDGATIKPSDVEQLVQAEYRTMTGKELSIQLVHSHRCYLN
jgi:radical SAM family uncharacterized protein/radical SAM-linked protein